MLLAIQASDLDRRAKCFCRIKTLGSAGPSLQTSILPSVMVPSEILVGVVGVDIN